jgi:hypothetical protein
MAFGVWEARDLRYFLGLDVAEVEHHFQGFLGFLFAFRRERNVVCVGADRAVEMILRQCIEDFARGGEARSRSQKVRCLRNGRRPREASREKRRQRGGVQSCPKRRFSVQSLSRMRSFRSSKVKKAKIEDSTREKSAFLAGKSTVTLKNLHFSLDFRAF